MKIIYNIARNELRQLFYSPIAWILLVLFFIQTGVQLSDTVGMLLRYKTMGYDLGAVTSYVFQSDWTGLFLKVQSYLYLYIPLLTMGIVSREKSSGTDKLLLAAPITETQVILGKFLSMMFYGLVLMSILFLLTAAGAVFIKSMDIGAVLTGLLGLYLLILAYAAIGIFMSSLTRYQIIAAVGCIAMLFAMNYTTRIGQEIPVVREVAYWIGISGRSNTFIEGLICSEDVIYFLAIIFLFLSMSVIKLSSASVSRSFGGRFCRYAGVILLTCGIGYFSSRPALMAYYDSTQMKSCTLTQNSQQVMEQLDGPLTITTYVNLLAPDLWTGLPGSYTRDVKRFAWYTRFKPEIKMKYVYYYHLSPASDLRERKQYKDLTEREIAEKVAKSSRLDLNMFLSPEQIDSLVDLSGEEYRFVRRIERGNGQQTFLRLYEDMQKHPGEREITAAMKRLVVKSPTIGVLVGHGERGIDSKGDRGYFTFARSITFRYALVNQGFDTREISLADGPVPEDVDILLIADPQLPLTPAELARVNEFTAAGGNLLIAGKPNNRDNLAGVLAPLGVGFMDGILVQQSTNYAQDLIVGDITPTACLLSKGYRSYAAQEVSIVGSGTMGIQHDGAREKGFEVYDLIATDSIPSDTTLVWNERQVVDFENNRAEFDPQRGEQLLTAVPVVTGLERKVGGKTQRIIVLGNADMISNGELMMSRSGINASNYALILESFGWLSEGEFPVNTDREAGPDTEIRYLTNKSRPWIGWIFLGIIPGLVALFGVLLLVRRKGR